MKCSLGISNFLEEISSLPFCCFPLFLCTDCWRRLSYLFLLFFGTLHSDVYIFPFLLCFLLLFFSQLFVRPLWTAILAFLHFFSMGMVLIPVSCTMSRTFDHSSSGTLSIKSREWWLGGCRRAERSYSTFKVRRGGGEEIPLVQGKEQQLRFARSEERRVGKEC